MSYNSPEYMLPVVFFERAQSQPDEWKKLEGISIEHIEKGIGIIKSVTMVTHNMGLKKYCENILAIFADDELRLKPQHFSDGTVVGIAMPSEARKEALLDSLQNAFEYNFLAADQILEADPDSGIIDRRVYNELKTKFVYDWAARSKMQLDIEQAAAIADTSSDSLVIARAGSGKTLTLSTRSIFLLKHCRVAPSEMLLLAFNKKAVEEMKSRLQKATEGTIPHVMTFHALAYALVHPTDELLFDDSSVDQFALSREVQDIVDEHLRSDEYHDIVRNLMITHFKDDWDRIIQGHFELTREEFLSYRQSLPRETLKGEYVKSFGEKLIANTLFEYGVKYQYEKSFRWDGTNYRPDFTIPNDSPGKKGIIIEYFGLEGDPDYDHMSAEKRQFWSKRPEWAFLEFSPKDISKDGNAAFAENLILNIRKLEVACNRLSERQIWKLVKRRALDNFTASIKNFIGRCRKLDFSTTELKSMAEKHVPIHPGEKLFLEIARSVYDNYIKRLTQKEKEDFDGLMWRAVGLVRNGQKSFLRDKGKERGNLERLRFIMIDEFQDFSKMFFELIEAIRLLNNHVRFFCVGDDWQAINAFAGSDLDFFKKFNQHFRNSNQYQICTNYRSPKLVVNMGNVLMQGLGEPARAYQNDEGLVSLCELDAFRPTPFEEARHQGDEITPAVLRLVLHVLSKGLDVVMLSRRNGIPFYVNYDDSLEKIPDILSRFLEHIRSYLSEDDRKKVTISTVHQYKGLERKVVIILDAIIGSYPLIHPNWIFLRVLGESIPLIIQEERRIFYVAITRSANSLFFLTERSCQSLFLDQITSRMRIRSVSWENFPPMLSQKNPRLEIRVSNAYKVKDELRLLSFKWNPTDRYWYKIVTAHSFSFDSLKSEPWAQPGVKIELFTETGALLRQIQIH